MKKTIIISLIAVASSVSAQIKVFPSSLHSYGSTTSPASGVNHQFTGNVVVSETGSTTSGCAYIRANGATNASSSSRPDYSWLGDIATGMFHPAANNIAFTTGYFERLRINNNGQVILSTTGISQSNPNIAWTGDVSTGIFQPASQNIGFTINGTEKMRITNNGNILVGGTTDNNAQKCIMTGVSDKIVLNLFATHTTDYQYAFVSNVNRSNAKAMAVVYNGTETFKVMGSGAVYGLGYYSISDRTLKDNIDTIPSALSKLLQLNGVTYNFKALSPNSNAMVGTVLPTGTPKKEIGLIAQDVELIVPEAVQTMDNGIKAVSYQTLVPLLIEAIKSQNKTITSLQNDVNNCCSKSTGGTKNRMANPSSDGSSSNEDNQSYMKQNKPNPFNKETVIEYNIVESGNASILVFDMNGKLLKTIPVKIPGKGTVTISANDFNPGMYYYSLIVNDNEVDTKKMILTE